MSSKYHIVSSQSHDYYRRCGKAFLDSFQSDDLKIFVGTEDNLDLFEKHENVTFFKLDKKLSSMLYNEMFLKLPDNLKKSYQFHAHKFCYKVQALNSFSNLPSDGYRVWIDSDVIFKKPINTVDLNKISNSADLTYLGRKDMWHSECGFIIFKLSEFGIHFLRRWIWFFNTGRIGLLPEWHDSYVFDVVRKEFNSFKYNNLSENIDGINVWENTILGEYMIHNKGYLKDVK